MAALTTSIPEVPGSGRNLGLPLLLDARCLLRRAGAQSHRRHAHDGGFHLLHTLSVAGSAQPIECGRSTACVHTGCPRGAHCAGARRLRRRRTGADRQRSGQPEPARCLRQHHHGRDADVLRPQACRGRAMRPCFARSSRSANRPRSSRSKPDAGIWEYRGRTARPHAFGGDVLGRLPAARSNRQPSQFAGPCQPIGAEYARQHRRARC